MVWFLASSIVPYLSEINHLFVLRKKTFLDLCMSQSVWLPITSTFASVKINFTVTHCLRCLTDLFNVFIFIFFTIVTKVHFPFYHMSLESVSFPTAQHFLHSTQIMMCSFFVSGYGSGSFCAPGVVSMVSFLWTWFSLFCPSACYVSQV